MERVLFLDKFCVHASPLGRSYDRLQRFVTKLDRLLGIGSMPRATDPVWAVLNNAEMHTPQDVRDTLRQTKLVNKHYDCVKPFCDAFTSFTCEPFNLLKTKEDLVRKFKMIKSLWGSREGFFSYDWLLRKFLEEYNSPLVAYLKKPTNKRREQKYQNMMKQIIVVSDDKTLNHNSVIAHSLNGLSHASTHPSQLYADEDPFVAAL